MGAAASLNKTDQNVVNDIHQRMMEYDGSIEEFTKIMDDVKKYNCSSSLGEELRVWNVACLNNHIKNPHTDLSHVAPEVIEKFTETEIRLLSMPESDEKKKLMHALEAGSGNTNYKYN